MKKFRIVFFVLLTLTAFRASADTIDNYQVYIKGKLVRSDSRLPDGKYYLDLGSEDHNTTLDIEYNHCTFGVGNRAITLVDGNGQVIARWSFPTQADDTRVMRIQIGDIAKQKGVKKGISYQLVYYDGHLKKGRVLTELRI